MHRKEKKVIKNILRPYRNNDAIQINENMDIHSSLELDLSKNCHVAIGNNLIARNNVSIRCRENATLELGENVFFNNNCVLTCREKIRIGNNVIIGPNVSIFDHDHDYKSPNRSIEYVSKEIKIEDNVWIGANACILKGSIIGENAVISAGSVVNGKVAPNTIYFNKNKTKKINIKEKNKR